MACLLLGPEASETRYLQVYIKATPPQLGWVGGVGAGVDCGCWGDAGESIDAYYEVNDFVRANGANKG